MSQKPIRKYCSLCEGIRYFDSSLSRCLTCLEKNKILTWIPKELHPLIHLLFQEPLEEVSLNTNSNRLYISVRFGSGTPQEYVSKFPPEFKRVDRRQIETLNHFGFIEGTSTKEIYIFTDLEATLGCTLELLFDEDMGMDVRLVVHKKILNLSIVAK